MARYLVTGATGFIGSHLVDELVARGHDVTCLARPSPRADRLRERELRVVEGDLRDPDPVGRAVEGCDGVFHLAGAIKALSPEAMREVNVDGTRTLVAACAGRSSPPVLVLVSSLAAAGPSEPGLPRREEDPCSPVSVYGRTKRGAEVAAASVADRLPTTLVRPPIVFGPRDEGLVPLFQALHRARVHVMPGFRRRWYSLVHVADLVEALLLVAESGSRLDPSELDSPGYEQGCYFVADDQPVTYGQLGRQIVQALGGRFALNLPVPEWVVLVSARVNDALSRRRGVPPIFNRDKAREATAGSWTCSAAKIRHDLGFETGTSLADGLRDTARWYREHGWL
jgi:nucleoside-diphosphate-sugar epimerase